MLLQNASNFGRAGRALLLAACAAPLAFALVLAPALAVAGFNGPCADCHTMHNSQDGGMVLPDGPRPHLLTVDCLGCHSSGGSSTVVSATGTPIPIVLNDSAPDHPLAGGNFHWVEQGADGNGHNVITPDPVLDRAPGSPTCGFGGCHESLAEIRLSAGGRISGLGCVACHDTRGAHHKQGLDLGGGYRRVGTPGDGTRGFRFLAQAGQAYHDIAEHTPPAVEGIEAPWSALQNPGASAHNEYQDLPKPDGGYGANPQGISDFCYSCHRFVHTEAGTWIRHPFAATLTASGEIASYTDYDPVVPVGRPLATLRGLAGPSAVVTPGQDQVMCLSCHYAHGGPNPDALRWDYADMIAGADTSAGCTRCHTLK